jgi:Uma2 family endonuclease
MSKAPSLFRFTVATYEAMFDQGILTENDPVELIRGEILRTVPVEERHPKSLDRICWVLVRSVGDNAVVSVQNTLSLADSHLRPDVYVRRPSCAFRNKCRPDDVMLVVEVADSSLEVDREEKSPLFAENGIVEYWIVNLVDKCLEVHRQPRPDGTYADVQTLRTGDSVSITSLPGLTFQVADLIGS